MPVPITPVELRHVKLRRAFRGYHRGDTEEVLEEVTESFEDVWRDRGELADKVEELEKQLADYKQREHLLTQTLVAAERSAAEARDSARREAELIIAEAHQEARSVIRGVQSERERLVLEARRITTLLRSALGLVEEGAGPSDWPDRSDTREFQAISEPPAREPEEPPDVDEQRQSPDFKCG